MIGPKTPRQVPTIWIRLDCLLDLGRHPTKPPTVPWREDLLEAVRNLVLVGHTVVIGHPSHYSAKARTATRRELKSHGVTGVAPSSMWPPPEGSLTIDENDADFLLMLADNPELTIL